MKKTAKSRNIFRIGAILMLTALWVMIPFLMNEKQVSADELSDTRIYASMAGTPINGVTPSGFAEYRFESDRRRLKVDAFSVNLPAGTQLSIVVNNAIVGQMTVNTFSGANLDLDTNDGQSVPFINFGNPIQVMQGTTVIVSGTFGTVTATPSPSGSPNASPTASPTGSPNQSPSPSPTGSPNASPSPSVSPTASPTGSPNPSPSVSPTASPNASPSPSPGGVGDLFAWLSGATVNGVVPNGFGQYEIHSSRRELEVRANQVNLPGGSALAVIIDNVQVGQMFVSSNEARLRLRTDEGQTVPVVVNGSIIMIQYNGTSILAGLFNGGTSPTPSPSPSVSPTASPTGSPNPSPTASPTGSPNPSPTVSPSPNESPSPSPSPNETPSPSPTPNLGRYFEVHPTGSQLSSPVTTGGTGEFKVFLNEAETQATITGEFHNLSSGQTSARIEAQIGSSNVIHNFGVNGGTSGSFETVTINVTPVQVQQLRAGLWFAVITSQSNPNGEIGGKLIMESNRADFDGDGSNDLAVFRPSTGTWYAQNSQGFSAQNFGSASDTPVSADYDGDGRSDKAVFKNVNGSGVWEINRSFDGGVTTTQFGFATDKPVRGDFDGDGRNDMAVFRPSTGVWYVQKSNNTGYIIVQFGVAEDIPVASDLDGDGKDDVAVFRPSTGVWYWIKSSNGSTGIVKFGQTGDKPIVGDFDGDGRNDVSVYRPSTGVWYIWRSVDGSFDIRQFGLSEDIPVAGNYDGDNKTDLAVFRPSTGTWYIWRSKDGTFDYRNFGLSGDIPNISQ